MSYLYRAPSGTVLKTREEIDQSYDVEASVEDFGVYVDFFVNGSAAARADYPNILSVQYGPTRAETLDIFPGRKDGPVVIFIHGGYWKSLSSQEFSLVAPGLVERGATVVIPNYALLPSVTIDEITRQMETAVAWVSRNIANYGADPQKLILSGHSAGGHLTSMLMGTDWAEKYGLEGRVIAAGCAISGLFDLRPLYYTSMQADFCFTHDQILRNSPIFQLPETAPKLLITLGGSQPKEFARQSRDYHTAWTAAGLDGDYWERPGLNHFNELEEFGDANSSLVDRILDLIECE